MWWDGLTVLWIIMNIVKQLAAGGGRLLGVVARFVLVFLVSLLNASKSIYPPLQSC
jgi:hypothetical protein